MPDPEFKSLLEAAVPPFSAREVLAFCLNPPMLRFAEGQDANGAYVQELIREAKFDWIELCQRERRARARKDRSGSARARIERANVERFLIRAYTDLVAISTQWRAPRGEEWLSTAMFK